MQLSRQTKMLNVKRKSKITLLSVIAILSLSTIMPALAFAAPLANSASNWEYLNGNSWAQNYSPQTQINQDNVEALEVKWIFPLGSKVLASPAMQGLSALAEGASTPPVVANGKVYVLSNWGRMYAADAKTGKALWEHDYKIDPVEIAARLPWVNAKAIAHNHGFQYWAKGNSLLSYGMACDFYGVNANTGEMSFHVEDLCLDVPGNGGIYRSSMANSATIGIYDKGDQFIVVQPGRIHSNIADVAPHDSRHVTMGINQNAPYNVEWRVFSSPAAGVVDKDWGIRECDIGFFRDIPCSEALAVNRAGLEWDYALPGEAPGWWVSVTANWGQLVVDEETGTMYTQTGNQGPYSNMSLAPGPRLFGSTIMAIDLDEGVRKWWLQPFPHDPYDYDCNWSGMLVDSDAFGKVYTYGCKEGRYFVMDSETGKPHLVVDIRDDMYELGQISTDPHSMLHEPDPRSYYDMREWNWISYPASVVGEPGKFCTLPCTVFPYWSNGMFGTDRAFDPNTQTYYMYEVALQVLIREEHSYFEGERNYNGGKMFSTSGSPIANLSLTARDIETGEIKWSWFYKHSQTRAAPITTGGLVVASFSDSYMRFFDKNTGEVLREINTGAYIEIQPTIGKDDDGNSKIFSIIGANRRAGRAQYGGAGLSATPGTLIAVGLSDRAAAAAATTTVTTTSRTTRTLTSTSTTTSVSTSTSRTTATSTTTATTTATSMSTRTLTSTSATTQTQTQTLTQTSTAPGQTQTATVTSEVTEEVGMSSTVTYAAIAVAVIAIIGAAVLYTRKQ